MTDDENPPRRGSVIAGPTSAEGATTLNGRSLPEKELHDRAVTAGTTPPSIPGGNS